MIQAADWRSVSIVHHIPIPSEIKNILDGLTIGSRPAPKASAPPLDRKTSGSVVKVPSVVSKSRTTSGSPKTPAATLSSSPNRKQVDLDTILTPRRNSGARAPPLLSKVSPARRTNPPPVPAAPVSKPARAPASRPEKIDDSASSGSGGSDSLSDSTVTSDGGFTDYLSDESEAELQRQAEAKAALLAQNQAEELEFKAARQQLAHVDLRPPKSWNPTNITNSTASRLTNATTKV